MGFEKKEWKDRLVEFAGRRTITDIETGDSKTVDVSRDEGLISQEGDTFSAKNMNDLEERIYSGFSERPTSTSVKEIKKVAALPGDAASHADTLYIIPG